VGEERDDVRADRPRGRHRDPALDASASDLRGNIVFIEPPRPPEPLTAAMRAWRIATWTLGLAALLLFAYGPVPAKAAVLALAAIALPWWFFRGFMDR
jgi:hypothetical protein